MLRPERKSTISEYLVAIIKVLRIEIGFTSSRKVIWSSPIFNSATSKRLLAEFRVRNIFSNPESEIPNSTNGPSSDFESFKSETRKDLYPTFSAYRYKE